MRFGVTVLRLGSATESSTQMDTVPVETGPRRRGRLQQQVPFIGVPRAFRRTLRSSTCTCSVASSCELEAKLTLGATQRSMPYLASPGSPRPPWGTKRTILQRSPQACAYGDSVSIIPAGEYGLLRRLGISALPGDALGVVSESFGERLRRIRESKGFSVPDLASAVGVSESAIRQLEVGNVKSPSFGLGLRLADRLTVDPYYLAVGEGFSVTERLNLLENRLMKLEQRIAALPTSRR